LGHYPSVAKDVVWNQRPRVTDGSGVLNDATYPFEKTMSVLIILEYFPAFNAAHDYMVKGAGSFYTRLSGHKNVISNQHKIDKFRC
jgi:hypothetical protein